MNFSRSQFLRTAVLSVLILCSTHAAQACATCFGQSDEAMAKGMNMGILSLLICIVGVLFGMVGVGIYLIRRAARLGSVQPLMDGAGDFGSPVLQNTK